MKWVINLFYCIKRAKIAVRILQDMRFSYKLDYDSKCPDCGQNPYINHTKDCEWEKFEKLDDLIKK